MTTEYIERGKAHEEILSCCFDPAADVVEGAFNVGVKLSASMVLKDIPAANVRPVVECLDCKYLDCRDESDWQCTNPGGMKVVHSDNFCSLGEAIT